MTRERLATITSSAGAGLLFATAGFHMSAYGPVTAQAPAGIRPLLAGLWVAIGVSLMLAALLVLAVRPLGAYRRRAILFIAALTPFSIAAVQLIYVGFIPPTALLLLDVVVIVAAAVLGHRRLTVTAPAA